MLPLFKAGLATIALFNVVGRWNDWFTGLMYIQDANLVPIQTMLQKIQQQLDFLKNNAAVTGTPDGIQYLMKHAADAEPAHGVQWSSLYCPCWPRTPSSSVILYRA